MCSSSYAHFVAGINHRNYFPMLVYRICDLMQWCIPTSKFVISLHNDKPSSALAVKKVKYAMQFMGQLGITPVLWTGNFTSNNKMVHYLEIMKYKNVDAHDEYIYHTGQLIVRIILQMIVYETD